MGVGRREHICSNPSYCAVRQHTNFGDGFSMKQSTHFPVFLAALGVLLFSLLDAVMKAQALAMGTYSAMFWRMAFGVLFALMLYSPSRVRPISGEVLRIHILRAVIDPNDLPVLFQPHTYPFGSSDRPLVHCAHYHPFPRSAAARGTYSQQRQNSSGAWIHGSHCGRWG